MHKIVSILAVSALSLALAACGGSNDKAFVGSSSSSSSSSGSSSSSSGSSSSSATAVAKITLITSAPQMPSDNSKPATITAILENSSNAVVPGAFVIFSASSGAIAPTQTINNVTPGTSDSNGEAAATLGTPGDPSDRTITVTATVGTVSATVNVAVIGTTLTVTGPAALIQGNSASYSVALTNSNGTGIPTQAVTVSSANGNTLSSASLTTDASGHATFMLTGKTAGADTVTASALSLNATQAVAVSGQNFNITTPAANANININTPQTVTVVWTNNGAPAAGQTVTFNTTRGDFTGGTVTTTATTDGTGKATATLSSTTAGPVVITASASGVSTQVTAEFIATTPASIDVQASPASIQTAGQSTITAIVWDANNNLVEGQTVDFQLTDTTGGSISVASAITDAQGRAQTVYTGGSVPSSQNGVTVTATVQGSAIPAATATLTVGGRTLFLSLGTGNTVLLLPAGCGSGTGQVACTQFGYPFSVQALDSSGNPVPGVAITMTVHSYPYANVPPSVIAAPPNGPGSAPPVYSAYAKGTWVTTAIATANNLTCSVAGSAWCQVVVATCFNEDVDGSGILKSGSEDINGNGHLDPKDVAAVNPGTVTTDSTGSGSVVVVYPQDHAEWVQALLIATATVSGNQTSTSSSFWLPIAATDVNSSSATPPGETSPYGTANACSNPN